jgi:hypothetical protein
VRRERRDLTVITVAHRQESVSPCDKTVSGLA